MMNKIGRGTEVAEGQGAEETIDSGSMPNAQCPMPNAQYFDFSQGETLRERSVQVPNALLRFLHACMDCFYPFQALWAE
ncbi:hypothetical protein H6G41_17570 [Tolypothrix sp. FACHB-123]|uniref:hypothetical protein n=1 Tax=Tolypothrix sp. FACHB-123 TaxID=2692868 RepID=UPI001681D213|nr:hypothetical protein [Tolypothrix sp. FACHB-123]MBD2356412.1 hypothetical protein [Tolypothrix sp. FACHB-123]